MAILSKGCKPYNFEFHNSLKFSFINIWGLCSNYADCKSILEWNSADILALCKTNLNDSIDFGNISVRGYLLLIWKDSTTHMHGLVVYMKEGRPLERGLSLENSADPYVCFQLALLRSVSYFFFLYQSPFSSLCTVFDPISSKLDEVLLINPSYNVFVFGDFNVHHKDWIAYSGGTEGPGELCFNFSISNDPSRLTFLLRSQTVILKVLLFWICFFMLTLVLAKLFSKCLKESCFPDCWKAASVVPVFTNVGKRSTAKNYRRVNLLSIVSKVFEKLVNNTIIDHFEKYGLFYDF